MNILYLCADRGIPVRGHKGAAVHVRAMTQAFARAGHAVTLLTPRPGPDDGPAFDARLVAVDLPEVNGGDSAESVAAANERLVAAALAHAPFDLIYERYALWSDAGARLSARLSARTGVPLVLEVNAPLRREAGRYRAVADSAAAAAVERAQFTTARHIAVVSAALRDYVVAHGAAPDRVHVLPNAVDPHHFHPAVRGGAVHHRHDLHDRIVVGFVGRIRPWHDCDTLLAAVGRLHAADPRYHLLLVGQTPDDIDARLAAHGLSGAATLTGPVPHDAVPPYIAAMTVAVSTHQRLDDFYFSPLKLYEYLACGAPTVAAEIGQSAEIITPYVTGLLYPPGDADALADHIRTLVDNPLAARQMGWAGAEKVLQQHTWDRNAAVVLDWVAPPAAPVAAPDAPIDRRVPPPLPLLDNKLRHRLYQATRPDLAAPLLGEALGRPGARVAAIDVLKYKPRRRCVLRYRLTDAGDDGALTVIGKLFRDDRGDRLNQLQRRLWDGGFAADSADGISVAAPLGYIDKMRMQLQACVPGATLNALVTRQPIAEEVARAAAALAKLHNWTPPDAALAALGRHALADETQLMARFSGELRALRPQDATTVTAVHDALLAWAAGVPAPPALVPVHRDYYYSQLLFDGARTTLIDFDLLAWGDPAIDVANFTAHLFFMGLDLLGDWHALAAEADRFRAAYAARRPPDATLAARVAFYEAATLFRLLNVVAPRPGLVALYATLQERVVAALAVGV